jgi:DNA-binding NtrC family response regulator
MTILVYYLDDEPELCDTLGEFLELKGLSVRTFVDAQVAIAACREKAPDVLFLDYRLSNTTGDLVAGEVDAAIKKVLVTGDLSAKTVNPFAKKLKKPFRLGEAYELVIKLCEER